MCGTDASLFTNSRVNGVPAATSRSACSKVMFCAVTVTTSPPAADAGADAGADPLGAADAGALGGADGASLGAGDTSALGAGLPGSPDGAPLAATSVGGGAYVQPASSELEQAARQNATVAIATAMTAGRMGRWHLGRWEGRGHRATRPI